MHGLSDVLGNALDAVDFSGPFGDRAVELAVVDFLEGFAVAGVSANLADDDNHRGAVLMGGMHADRCIGGAGATGHHQNTGLAGQFGVGVGHEGGAAFLTADYELGFLAVLMQAFKHGEVAFAGHAKNGVDTVNPQSVGENLAAMAGLEWGSIRHNLRLVRVKGA